jgi:hypothetical protein
MGTTQHAIETTLNCSARCTAWWSSLSTKKWTHRYYATMRVRCPSHFRWVASNSFRTVVQLPNTSRCTKKRKQRWLIVTNAGLLYHIIAFLSSSRYINDLDLYHCHCPLYELCSTSRSCMYDGPAWRFERFHVFVIILTGLDFLWQRRPSIQISRVRLQPQPPILKLHTNKNLLLMIITWRRECSISNMSQTVDSVQYNGIINQRWSQPLEHNLGVSDTDSLKGAPQERSDQATDMSRQYWCAPIRCSLTRSLWRTVRSATSGQCYNIVTI